MKELKAIVPAYTQIPIKRLDFEHIKKGLKQKKSCQWIGLNIPMFDKALRIRVFECASLASHPRSCVVPGGNTLLSGKRFILDEGYCEPTVPMKHFQNQSKTN